MVILVCVCVCVCSLDLMLAYPATIFGKGPKARSGHTASLIPDQRIVVFGGSHGRQWLRDVHVLHYGTHTYIYTYTHIYTHTYIYT